MALFPSAHGTTAPVPSATEFHNALALLHIPPGAVPAPGAVSLPSQKRSAARELGRAGPRAHAMTAGRSQVLVRVELVRGRTGLWQTTEVEFITSLYRARFADTRVSLVRES